MSSCGTCKNWDHAGRTINNHTGPEAERWCNAVRSVPLSPEFAFFSARLLTKEYQGQSCKSFNPCLTTVP